MCPSEGGWGLLGRWFRVFVNQGNRPLAAGEPVRVTKDGEGVVAYARICEPGEWGVSISARKRRLLQGMLSRSMSHLLDSRKIDEGVEVARRRDQFQLDPPAEARPCSACRALFLSRPVWIGGGAVWTDLCLACRR
ncbi:MAG: hypothetical protein AAB368_07505 [bacterium]